MRQIVWITSFQRGEIPHDELVLGLDLFGEGLRLLLADRELVSNVLQLAEERLSLNVHAGVAVPYITHSSQLFHPQLVLQAIVVDLGFVVVIFKRLELHVFLLDQCFIVFYLLKIDFERLVEKRG